MRKTLISVRVYIIADKFGITQNSVHTIISSYIEYCKALLIKGERVELLGLVTLVPDVILSKYKTTLAFICTEIANDLGMPYYTVFSVIREYLDSLIEEVKAGTSIEVRGLVAVYPLEQNGVVTKVHSLVSESIKSLIRSSNTPVTSVRAHTNKLLKYDINKAIS